MIFAASAAIGTKENTMKTLTLLMLALCGTSLLAEETQAPPAYLQPLDELLPSSPPDVDMSCPLGRLDVMVHQGIAFWRLTLQAHNGSGKLESAFLRFPMPEDTLVSRFRIWDQGKLYEGTIGPRKKAEKVYQKVSGDTVPNLERLEKDRQQKEIRKRDPGLARQSGRLFELRVAPILPGETKQIQLFGHRRLPSSETGFHWTRDLRDLARLQHDTRGDLPCLDFKVTADFVELNGLDSVQGIDSDIWDVAQVDDQRWTVTSIPLNHRTSPSVNWVITPDLAASKQVWGITSKVGDDQRMLLRLHRDAATDVNVEPVSPFYIGCWRFQEVAVNKIRNRRDWDRERSVQESVFNLETNAYLTLFNLCRFSPGQKFSSSYHVRTRARNSSPYYGDFSLSKTSFQNFAQKLFESRPNPKTKHKGIDVTQHLEDNLKDGIKDVLLFIDRLDFKTYQKLKGFSKSVRILVFYEETEFELADSPNLTLVDLDTIADTPSLMNLNDFTNHDSFYLKAFRPYRGPILPSGDAVVAGLRVERIGRGSSPWIWVSGNVEKMGSLALTLSPPKGGLLATDSWHRYQLNLDEVDDGGLWGGSFSARTELQRHPTSTTIEEREELSRRWSFLTPETAFIALPGDLERRFGFAPENRSAQDHMGGLAPGTPEPHEWAIILMLASLVLYRYQQQRKMS